MAEKRKFFLCNGKCVLEDGLSEYAYAHIVGELVRVDDEGRKVTALARYLISVPTSAMPAELPPTDEYLIGDARRIVCRHSGCQQSYRWEINQGSILALMATRGKEVLSLFQKDV